MGNPVLSTRNPSIDWPLPSPPLPLAAMSQRFACAASPHHHFGVEDGWGGLGGNDSHAFFFRPCPRLHHCFGRLGNGGSTWAAKHFRSAERLSMQRQIQGPAVSVSVCLGGLGGRPRAPETHIGVAAGSSRDMRRRRERDFCQSNDSVLDLPLVGHVPTGGMPALRVSIGNARRMPSVDAWIRRAQKRVGQGPPRVSGGKEGGSRPGKLSRRVAAAGFRPRCRRSAPMPAPLPQVGGACSP